MTILSATIMDQHKLTDELKLMAGIPTHDKYFCMGQMLQAVAGSYLNRN